MKTIVLFFMGLFSAYAQNSLTANQLFDKVSAAYIAENYLTYNASYMLYDTYTSNNVYEQYKGFFIKQGKATYFKLHNTEVITTENIGAKISHDQKAILISDNGTPEQAGMMPILASLPGFTPKLTTTQSQYICELTSGKVTQLSFNKIIVYINKKSFKVEKQVMFLSTAIERKNSSGKTVATLPRLEISFSERKKDTKKDTNLVNIKKYFVKQGNTLQLSKNLSGYKIFHSN